MQIKTVSMVAAGALVLALVASSATNNNQPGDTAVQKGAQWIASVQGHDGGWGQDGGETSYVRHGERLETNGNDVANTAVAAEALLHTGNTLSKGAYRDNLQQRVAFILPH